MTENLRPSQMPQVASLHLHPPVPGQPFTPVETIELVEGKGVVGDVRYFERKSRSTGEPSKRQVTLIEREQIAEHAAAFGLQEIPPGCVRSNIETTGIELSGLVGSRVKIGTAVLLLYAHRDPCPKMDAICAGLRERMMNGRQGVLAQVLKGGQVSVGDDIVVL